MTSWELMNMLNKNSAIPLYNQLINILINDIKENYSPHSKILSEREICEHYNVSRTTVRLALSELENMGYIYKQHGKGTFASDILKDKKNLVENYSFTEHMKELNKNPQTIIVSFEEIVVNQHIGSVMGLPENERVYRLERIRCADKEPMMYEISYLPVSEFPNLSIEQVSSKALYDVFQDEYHQFIKYADEEFSASILTEKEADILKQVLKNSCLRIQRLSHNERDKVIEYTLSTARSDQFVYKVRHTR